MAPTKRQRPSLAAILAVADRQHGLITRAQLLDGGVTPEGIKHRVRTGRIHRVWPSVFAVGRPKLTREGRWLAAVLACGEGAALSHLCASAHWGIWERPIPPRPQVSVPSRNGGRGVRGIEVHRTALERSEATVRNAVPVTSLPRTLADLAAVLSAERLRSALRQCERLHRLDLASLRASLDASPRHSVKHARLRRALDAYVPGTADTEADAEMAFLELCARHGLPAPEAQVRIGRYRADFMWPDLHLVVEIDDRQSHDGYVAFQDDRVRDRTMKAAGLEVLRFTRTEVLRNQDGVALELRHAHARARRARLNPPR